MIIHEIPLSTEDYTSVDTKIQIKQGDAHTHRFLFSGIDFASCDRAVIKFLRPDNIPVSDLVTIENGIAEYSVCPACIYVSGNVTSEVSLYFGDGRITSCSFTFEVIPGINTDTAISANENLPVLTKLIGSIKNSFTESEMKALTEIIRAKADGKDLSSKDFTSEDEEYLEGLIRSGQKDIYVGGIKNREATDFSYIKYGIPSLPAGSTVYAQETTLQEVLDKKANAADIINKIDANGSAERLHIDTLSVNEIQNGAETDFSFIGVYGDGEKHTLQDELDSINDSIGNIAAALDNILALQQSYIGGDGV